MLSDGDVVVGGGGVSAHVLEAARIVQPVSLGTLSLVMLGARRYHALERLRIPAAILGFVSSVVLLAYLIL